MIMRLARTHRPGLVIAVMSLALAAAACATTSGADAAPTTTSPPPTITTTTAPTTSTTTSPATTTSTTTSPATTTTSPTTTVAPPEPGTVRPDWLGKRPLPLAPNGFGEVLPTPPELVNRRFPTIDLLPPPADGFASTIESVPVDVAARSTWSEECPVTLDELRYVTVSFWGFEGTTHTGELLVNATVAADIAQIFAALYDARFPIEEMRVVRADELDLPPTGDGNNTSAFVCRPVVGTATWSQHAYGLALDVNPFQNPYGKGDVVLPELASAYLDRSNVRPGMIEPGDPVTTAFTAAGWAWGGDFQTLTDSMHFSANGR